MVVKIDLLKCTGCGTCAFVCPVGVLSVEDMKCRVAEGCISCGACVNICPFQAMTLEDEQIKSGESKRGEAPLSSSLTLSLSKYRRRGGRRRRGRRP